MRRVDGQGLARCANPVSPSRAAQDARTPEEVQQYVQKIKDILEWVWPTNTCQRFDVFEHGDVRIEIPAAR
jgi:hypothetical protein